MDWMSRLNEDIPLNKVTLPGTHNSGSYGINILSPINPHKNEKVLKWLKVAKYTLPCINVNYSKVQNQNLVEQFKTGIRIFDLRVAKYGDKYRFTHGLLGNEFFKEITELVKYSQKYKKEVLIFYIKFVFGFDDNDHINFQEQLKNIIGSRLAESGKFRPTTQLQKFWNQNKNIIVIYKNKHRTKPFWKSSALQFKWPNTTDSDKAIKFIDRYLVNDDNGKFFGVDAVLTPTGGYIASHPFGSTQNLAKDINVKMYNLLSYKKLKNVSFIMYDVSEYPNLSKKIIDSNFQ